MNEDTKIQEPEGNEVLPCVSGSISINVALGIKKYHKEFNVDILEYKGLSETNIFITVMGKMEDIVKLNEKATHYKPSETRGI